MCVSFVVCKLVSVKGLAVCLLDVDCSFVQIDHFVFFGGGDDGVSVDGCIY